ncbi:MAG: hypothetical protein RMK98_03540, partial [Bacteroidia bacterium]|nr:hypothetical protein [Bacteroidia bacterium]
FARGNNLTGAMPTVINPAGFVAQGTIRGIMGEARSTTPVPRSGGYFERFGGGIYSRVAAVTATDEYKILGTGTVNTVIQDGAGGVRLLTAPEAPQFLFQDFGEAALEEGVAFVSIEPKLLPYIQYDKLLAWVTPLGPCQGLYVQLTDRGGFYVREKNGGRSSVRFMWAWSAPVKGWERFPAAPPPPPVAKGRP